MKLPRLMGEYSGDSPTRVVDIPDWFRVYLQDFRQILDCIRKNRGFILFPVVIPGVDIADALRDFLSASQCTVNLVKLDSASEWKNIVPILMRLPQRRDRRVVMLLEPEFIAPEVSEGLTMMNLWRTSIIDHIGGPLLACGSSDFLNAFQQRAPDFWSIRHTTLTLKQSLDYVISHVTAVRPEHSRISAIGLNSFEMGFNPASLIQLIDASLKNGDYHTADLLALDLAQLHTDQGRYDDAQSVIDGLLSRQENAPTAGLVTRANFQLTKLALLQNKPAEAIVALERLRHATKTEQQQADFLRLLGEYYLRINALRDADDVLQQARTAFVQLKDFQSMANTCLAICSVHVGLKRIDDAEQSYQNVLNYYMTSGDQKGEAYVRHELGRLYAGTSRLQEAESAYNSAIVLYEKNRNLSSCARVQQDLASLLLRLCRFQDALVASTAAVDFYQSQNEYERLGKVLRVQARAYMGVGEFEKSFEAGNNSLQLFTQLSDIKGQALALYFLGTLCDKQGNLDAALNHFDWALKFYVADEDRPGQAACHQMLSLIYIAKSKLLQARIHIDEAYRLHINLRDRASSAKDLCIISQIQSHEGDFRAAIISSRESRDILRDYMSIDCQLDALAIMNYCFEKIGDSEGAAAAKVLADALAYSIYQFHSKPSLLSPVAAVTVESTDTAETQLNAALKRVDIKFDPIRSARAGTGS